LLLLTLYAGASSMNCVVDRRHNSDNTDNDYTLSNDDNMHDFDQSSLLRDDAQPSCSRLSVPYTSGKDGASFLTDFFLHSNTTGITASPFSACLQMMQQNLALHGIVVYGLSEDEYRLLLIRHILVGDCLRGHQEHDRTACRYFKEGFSTAKDMAASAFATLLSATAAQRSTEDLLFSMKALNIRTKFRPRNLRRQIVEELQRQALGFLLPQEINSTDFMKFERYDRPTLLSIASSHCIPIGSFTATKENLKTEILSHFARGDCSQRVADARTESQNGCKENIESLLGAEVTQLTDLKSMRDELVVQWLISQQKKLASIPLRRLLGILELQFDPVDNIRKLRLVLRKFISKLKRDLSKTTENDVAKTETANKLNRLRSEWPLPIAQSLKEKLISMFREQTSSESYRSVTCAACAESVLASQSNTVVRSR
jgi:hypothetical protein